MHGDVGQGRSDDLGVAVWDHLVRIALPDGDMAYRRTRLEVPRLAVEPVVDDDTIDALPKVTNDPAHTAGLEPAIYRQRLADLRKAANLQ